MKLLIALFLVFTLHAATVVNVACGSTSDNSFTGGARWTGAAVSGNSAPYNAMRSSSPAGVPFSYTFQLQPGQYTVTLMFLEPRADQTAGQRLLNVAINGAAVVTGLDLFSQVGALKPYRASFPVTVTSALKLDFSATAGNAVVSGIQVDSVDTPTLSGNKGQCEAGLGSSFTTPDGRNLSGNLFTGTYAMLGCENMSGATMFITRVRCRSDVAGQIFDILDSNGKSLLTAPLVCTPTGAEAELVPGASYPDGTSLLYRTTIVDTPPQNATQVLGTIIRESGPPAAVATLRECTGSGPGWICNGLLWATIPLQDGFLVQLMGASMPDYQPGSGITWTERK